MKMKVKLMKSALAMSLSFVVFIPTFASAAPTTMPFVGGKLAQVQASWAKLGFTHLPKLVTQKPPAKSYHCRTPTPADLIISQDPIVGAPVTADTQVTLTLICRIGTPQNAVVKKPYAPKRGKLNFTPKNLADAKKHTAPKKPALPKTSTSPQKAATKVSITCVKGKKTIKVSAVKPTCPSGYKKK
jgi:hypothetical protein